MIKLEFDGMYELRQFVKSTHAGFANNDPEMVTASVNVAVADAPDPKRRRKAKRSRGSLDHAKAIAAYKSGDSTIDIARTHSVSVSAVAAALKKGKVKMRPRGKRKK